MSDTIEKQILIRAPRSRVWRAIADKTEYGQWFGVRFEDAGTFAAGEHDRGNITYPGYEHVVMNMEVVEVEPERRFAFRWHPYAIDATVDYSGEPTTLVTFALEDADGGTRLRIVESGFDAIPLHRRAEAWRMNDRGWSEQVVNVERHVTAAE